MVRSMCESSTASLQSQPADPSKGSQTKHTLSRKDEKSRASFGRCEGSLTGLSGTDVSDDEGVVSESGEYVEVMIVSTDEAGDHG